MTLHRRTLRRIEEPGHARYLTFSNYRRLPLFGNDRIKDAFAAHLARMKTALGFELYAWVIMPDHVHLLLRPSPRQTVEAILRRLKPGFARRIIERWRRVDAEFLARISDAAGSPHFWQLGGGYDRNVVAEVCEKTLYIHDNPVRRGLVDNTLEYRWSSARWYDQNRTFGPTIDPWE